MYFLIAYSKLYELKMLSDVLRYIISVNGPNLGYILVQSTQF